MKFSVKDFFSKCEPILNGKLHFSHSGTPNGYVKWVTFHYTMSNINRFFIPELTWKKPPSRLSVSNWFFQSIYSVQSQNQTPFRNGSANQPQLKQVSNDFISGIPL